MSESAHHSATPSQDQQVADRLVPVWLEEAARYDERAAGEARRGWEEGRLSPDAARELADWVTARVTDTAFNADEGPAPEGRVRVSVADKTAVHRWLAAQGYDV
ncbi:hypothetical protein ACIRD2_32825 [Streptomyces sp. NPDC093595]|jgi:hypothetical protein|uniref:hypothetical protein n=1 Tax=unclassified Streptomyces TaxID=2593676 RepID=UPI00379B2031